MSQSSGRLAIGSFEAWELALRVLADLLRSGIAPESAIFLALSGVFSTRPANLDTMRDFIELAFHELGERVCCSAGPLATESRPPRRRRNSNARALAELLALTTARQEGCVVCQAAQNCDGGPIDEG